MKKQLIKATTVIVVVLSTACTTQLELRRTDSFNDTLPSGITYSLPAVSYQTDTSWELTKCKNQNQERPFYKIDVTSEITENHVPDDDHGYVLNYEALDSGAKITTLDLSFHEGTPFLKSLNSQADDRTGEIIGNVVNGVLAVASATSGFPGLPVAAVGTEQAKVQTDGFAKVISLFNCRQSVSDALANIEANKTEIFVLKKEIKHLKSLDWLTGEPESNLPEKCRNLGENYVERKQCLQDAIDAKTQNIQNYQNAITKTKKDNKLGYVQKSVVVPTFCESKPGSNGKCERKLVFNEQVSDLSDALDVWFENFVTDSVKSSINQKINLNVELISTNPAKSASRGVVGDEALAGVIYRNPRAAEMTLTRSGENLNDELARQQVIVPQAGELALLPFKNEEFDNNTLTVSFTHNGSLISAKYTTQAAAEQATAAFAENAKSFLEYRQAQNDQELTELKRDIDLIRAEEEKIKAQQSLDSLRN